MSFLIHVYNRRTRQFVIDLFEADGSTPVLIAVDDVVRIKIGANGETPSLDLSSIAPTENYSKVAFTPGTNDVVLPWSTTPKRNRRTRSSTPNPGCCSFTRSPAEKSAKKNQVRRAVYPDSPFRGPAP
jgi:hypothetical protein